MEVVGLVARVVGMRGRRSRRSTMLTLIPSQFSYLKCEVCLSVKADLIHVLQDSFR